MSLSRDDYKRIKRLDKQNLTAYLQLIYRKGYDAGVAAANKQSGTPKPEAPNCSS